MHLTQQIETKLAQQLRVTFDVGISEYRALLMIAKTPDLEIRMQELASHLLLNQSSVTRLVERLEKKGYTTRDVCPNDGRGVYCVLTASGLDFVKKVEGAYDDCLESSLNGYVATQNVAEIADSLAVLGFGVAADGPDEETAAAPSPRRRRAPRQRPAKPAAST